MLPTNVYRGGVLTSVLRFVQFYSECVHADVLQAGMHLIRNLCGHCEPSDPSVDAWIESLTALLDHRDQQVVVNNALHALASIVNRFARSGGDPTPLATADLIARLSDHLYKASSNGYVAEGQRSTSYYRQSNMDFNEASVPSGDSIGELTTTFLSLVHVMWLIPVFLFFAAANMESHGPSATGSPSNPALVNSLTNLLLTLCCSSTVATQHLLKPENRLASTLATILLNWGDEGTLTNAYRLIEVIILILGENDTGKAAAARRRTRRRKSTRVSTGEDEFESGDPAPVSWESLSKYRAAVEAIKSHNISTFGLIFIRAFLLFVLLQSLISPH